VSNQKENPMRIADILADKGSRVCIIDHEHPLRDVIGIMHGEKIGAVVIMNGLSGVPIGIVSMTEVLQALQQYGASALKHCATGIMRKPPPQCGRDTSLRAAMRQMTLDRTRHLLVIDDAGAVTGIVSMGDLVAARLEGVELEVNVLRDMAQSHMLSGNA